MRAWGHESDTEYLSACISWLFFITRSAVKTALLPPGPIKRGGEPCNDDPETHDITEPYMRSPSQLW